MRLFLLSMGLESPLGTEFIKRHIPPKEVTGKRILVVSLPWVGTDRTYRNNCLEWGFEEENIVLSEDYEPRMGAEFEFVYVTAGNTFDVLQYMRQKGLCQVIREIAEKGTYVGASAGVLIAGTDICQAKYFDDNNAGMPEEEQQALALFEGTILPHLTFTEFRQFFANMHPKEKERYAQIYYVADDEGLMLTGAAGEEEWSKRYRWE